MVLKHKVIKEFQYLSPDKKIFILKIGTILENYTYKCKSEIIPIDKEIIDNNPEFFEIVDWKAEMLAFMKSNKFPQPSVLYKKLLPFLEDVLLSSISSNDTTSVSLEELNKKMEEMNLFKNQLVEKEIELKRREDDYKKIDDRLLSIEKREKDIDIKEKELIKKEENINTVKKDIEAKTANITLSNNDITKAQKDLQNAKDELDTLKKVINEKDNNLKDKEDELDVREERVSNRESSYISSMEELNRQKEELRIKNKELKNKLLDCQEKEDELNEKERDIDNKQLQNSDLSGKYKDMQEKINKDIVALKEKEDKINMLYKQYQIDKEHLDDLIKEGVSKENDGKYDALKEEMDGIESDVQYLNRAVVCLENLNHPIANEALQCLLKGIKSLKKRCDIKR